MPYIIVDYQLPVKPEMLAVAAELGLSDAENFLAWFRLWTWFDAHVDSDGLAVGVTLSTLSRVAGLPGYAEAHAKPGRWLEAGGEGVRVRNFERHNGKGAKARYHDALRKASARTLTGSPEAMSGACPKNVRVAPGQKPDSTRTKTGLQVSGSRPDKKGTTLQDSTYNTTPLPPEGENGGGGGDEKQPDPEWVDALAGLCEATRLPADQVPPGARDWTPAQLDALRVYIVAEADAGRSSNPAGLAAHRLKGAPDAIIAGNAKKAASKAAKAVREEQAARDRAIAEEAAERQRIEDDANRSRFDNDPEAQAAWAEYCMACTPAERTAIKLNPEMPRRYWLRSRYKEQAR